MGHFSEKSTRVFAPLSLMPSVFSFGSTRNSRSRAMTSVRTKIFYGLGSIAFGVKDNGFQTILLPFYNQVVHLPPLLTGLARNGSPHCAVSCSSKTSTDRDPSASRLSTVA